jgi:hypothetical protein
MLSVTDYLPDLNTAWDLCTQTRGDLAAVFGWALGLGDDLDEDAGPNVLFAQQLLQDDIYQAMIERVRVRQKEQADLDLENDETSLYFPYLLNFHAMLVELSESAVPARSSPPRGGALGITTAFPRTDEERRKHRREEKALRRLVRMRQKHHRRPKHHGFFPCAATAVNYM